MNLIMLGAPGAGKGTQAERVARQHGVPKISTGDMLRDGIRQGLPLALVAKAKMDRGELVDDDTMIGIVRERLSRPDAVNGFVLDGFPRTVAQGRALDGLMSERGSGPLMVIDIVVPEDEIVRRLAVRRICSKCGTNADPADAEPTCRTCGGTLVHRSDDDERVVRERLRVYEGQTKPLVDYYRSRPTFGTVNGAQSPDRVAEELEATIADAARAAAGASLGARG
ncbi:MAG: adenylate kinase [Acidobacteria bacterium RIFCSPLOWO2_12_FULL_67_14]|nr:MAG: adenylate kinase [Acidobacteria bacterium RIFCSPLOWO2_02_FULL_67_21]OFW37719.1 MAG: adenylate kinase [Acidobacteria bacterium RIFCSPLOWO2_12_FULL_67_14]